YADAIVQNGAAVNLCAPGGEEVAKKIAAIMGVSLTPKERDIAVIHCQSGGYNNTAFKFEYKGINSCRSAATIAGGPNQCIWGCVFQYDCVKACQFDALHITEDGMKVVNEDNCTGCGACVKACPRSLIELVPISKRVHILCSSRDKGPIAKKSCGNNTACIACGLCVKNCPTQAITIVNNLAIIDYSKCINCGICASVCPTKAIEDRMLPRKEAFIHEDQCIGCTICAKKCPVQAISGELKHPHKVDPKLCVGCEVCVKACPKNAIEMGIVNKIQVKDGRILSFKNEDLIFSKHFGKKIRPITDAKEKRKPTSCIRKGFKRIRRVAQNITVAPLLLSLPKRLAIKESVLIVA
ncbi:MAG TPA: 4Fe-4S binding protein, partial [Candidatus Cloacimonadota bacterium]|nr:4Fe-4S binding protein [Candidatus Cloacimonadota bacterium]